MPEEANTTEKMGADNSGETVNTDKPEKQQDKEPDVNFESILSKIAKGTMKLQKPIRAASKDVTELTYDFEKVTGWQYAEALGQDKSATDPLTLTTKQALMLFAAAVIAGTKEKELDITDIRERIGICDARIAVRIAAVFTRASDIAGDKRISNA